MFYKSHKREISHPIIYIIMSISAFSNKISFFQAQGWIDISIRNGKKSKMFWSQDSFNSLVIEFLRVYPIKGIWGFVPEIVMNLRACVKYSKYRLDYEIKHPFVLYLLLVSRSIFNLNVALLLCWCCRC